MESERQKVEVWVYRGREKLQVLLLKTLPSRESFWQPVTGSVDPGEELIAAALREAREETGFAFDAKPESLGKSFAFVSRGERIREYGFSLRAPEGASDQVTLDPHEHAEARWVSTEEAFRLLRFESNAEMLRELLHRFGQH